MSISAQSTTSARLMAQKVEAAFVKEMLRSPPLAGSESSSWSKRNESQFSSFLNEAHAEAIVKSGGVGLADTIFEYITR